MVGQSGKAHGYILRDPVIPTRRGRAPLPQWLLMTDRDTQYLQPTQVELVVTTHSDGTSGSEPVLLRYNGEEIAFAASCELTCHRSGPRYASDTCRKRTLVNFNCILLHLTSGPSRVGDGMTSVTRSRSCPLMTRTVSSFHSLMRAACLTMTILLISHKIRQGGTENLQDHCVAWSVVPECINGHSGA